MIITSGFPLPFLKEISEQHFWVIQQFFYVMATLCLSFNWSQQPESPIKTTNFLVHYFLWEPRLSTQEIRV
jgi:hypothetical protein